MEETKLEDSPIVVRQLAENPLHRRLTFFRVSLQGDRQRQVVSQLGLGQPEASAPETSEDGARRGEKVSADGGGGSSLAKSWDGFERDLLSEILGVGSVADPDVDEGVDVLELVARVVRRA